MFKTNLIQFFMFFGKILEHNFIVFLVNGILIDSIKIGRNKEEIPHCATEMRALSGMSIIHLSIKCHETINVIETIRRSSKFDSLIHL